MKYQTIRPHKIHCRCCVMRAFAASLSLICHVENDTSVDNRYRMIMNIHLYEKKKCITVKQLIHQSWMLCATFICHTLNLCRIRCRRLFFIEIRVEFRCDHGNNNSQSKYINACWMSWTMLMIKMSASS